MMYENESCIILNYI